MGQGRKEGREHRKGRETCKCNTIELIIKKGEARAKAEAGISIDEF
jgi:hypothetical protein